METEFDNPAPVVKSSYAEVDKGRALDQVQTAMIIAKRFPRDPNTAYTKVIEACKRPSLAATAMYKYPRGGQDITGPSIRLAEVLAQNYGNLDFGVRELERRINPDGQNVSIAESYCWDMETNTRQTKVFEVPHEIELKNKVKKKLTDPRDVYELVANNGARRLRACILGIIPIDFVEGAVNQCRETLRKGNGEPLADRIRKVLVAFKDLGVTQEMIEKRLGHSAETIIPDEIVDLQAVYTALKDKQSKRSDFFDFETQAEGGAAAELNEVVKKQKGEKK